MNSHQYQKSEPHTGSQSQDLKMYRVEIVTISFSHLPRKKKKS